MDKQLTPDDLRKAGDSLHASAYRIYADAWQSQLDQRDKRIAELEKALQSLYDEQNGAPLPNHERHWQAAMDEASRLLNMRERETSPKID